MPQEMHPRRQLLRTDDLQFRHAHIRFLRAGSFQGLQSRTSEETS